MLKTKVLEVEKEIIVSQEGELLQENIEIKKHQYLAKNKEEFYLMYSYLIDILKSSKDLKIKVYAYLLSNYNSDSTFQIGKPIKNLLAREFNVSIGSISNILTILKEENLIFSPDRGLYMLNPKFAFKGSSKERHSQREIMFKLGCKNC